MKNNSVLRNDVNLWNDVCQMQGTFPWVIFGGGGAEPQVCDARFLTNERIRLRWQYTGIYDRYQIVPKMGNIPKTNAFPDGNKMGVLEEKMKT